MKRDQLLAAIAADDWDTIGNLGWADVFRDLKQFFSPKSFSSSDAMSFVRVLGNHDPLIVHRAVQSLAELGEEWRPKPAKLASEVMRLAAPASRPGTTSRRAGATNPAVVALVASFLADGDTECSCLSSRGMTVAATGVIRCGRCGGLDPGQVDDVKEAAA